MKLKELEWYSEYNREVEGKMAIDDVYVRIENYISNRICIIYNTFYKDDKWHVYIECPGGIFRQEVKSLDEGKKVCAEYRQKFWNNLYNRMFEEIFIKEE